MPVAHSLRLLVCEVKGSWPFFEIFSICTNTLQLKEASEYLTRCGLCMGGGEREVDEQESAWGKHYSANQPLLSQVLLSRLRIYGIWEEESLVNHSPTVSPDPSPDSCIIDEVNSLGLNSCERRQNKIISHSWPSPKQLRNKTHYDLY